jgi:hypothetical protein
LDEQFGILSLQLSGHKAVHTANARLLDTFFEARPRASIAVVISTHAAEDHGQLVTHGQAGAYKAAPVHEVSRNSTLVNCSSHESLHQILEKYLSQDCLKQWKARDTDNMLFLNCCGPATQEDNTVAEIHYLIDQ